MNANIIYLDESPAAATARVIMEIKKVGHYSKKNNLYLSFRWTQSPRS